MSEDKEATVQILFRPPPRREGPEVSELHELSLESVPFRIAREMTEDFATFKDGETSRYQTYNYAPISSEGEALLALDLDEVVALRAEA